MKKKSPKNIIEEPIGVKEFSRPGTRRPARKENKKVSRFPGDFKLFQESEEKKQSLIEAEKKFQKDKQHPVKGKHAAFDRLVNAGKREVEAFKKYRKNRADALDKARAGFKSGSKGCKLAMKGKGRAYGKNS